MSVWGSDPTTDQPEQFIFAPEILEKAKAIIAKYPAGRQRSAVMPLLDLAQRQHNGWLPRAAMEYVAELLSMPTIRVYEIASFYTMYNLKPVGKYFVQVCRTTPCWLRGGDGILQVCKQVLGIGLGQTTPDGKFSLIEVECLGACVNAPMIQINDDYYEDLTPELVRSVLEAFQRGEEPPAGSQSGRQFSAPEGGATTLRGGIASTGDQ